MDKSGIDMASNSDLFKRRRTAEQERGKLMSRKGNEPKKEAVKTEAQRESGGERDNKIDGGVQ